MEREAPPIAGSSRRLEVLQGHLKPPPYSCSSGQGDSGHGKSKAEVSRKKASSSAPMSSSKDEVQKAFPRARQNVLKWNGWGYKDSGFVVDEKEMASFVGSRYVVSGDEMPNFIPWMKQKTGFDASNTAFSQPSPDPSTLPKPIPCPAFIEAVRHHCVYFSDEPMDRLMRSHGHTCHELFNLRMGKYGRLPDLVVWPGCHSDVENIVKVACAQNVCIVPFGGGTNVSYALMIPPEENRVVVSLDMTEMDKILWLDEENLTVHVEGGIIGQDLERQLGERGYTTGHEPDSLEFSSLGGWVATRSSGMKKNVYGNIEDLVVRARMVTPQGTMQRNFLGPRNSIGPDIQHFMLGSEGMFGVITEVTMRIRPTPEVRRYGSVVFPDFRQGVLFMREMARQRCAPASIRLMDNIQFQLGQAMKPAASFTQSLLDSLKKVYLTKFKGYNVDEISACTILFEGSAAEVATQEAKIYELSAKFSGIPGGEENGRRGYLFTFVVAYIRDLGFDYSYLSESFETSVPWSRVYDLCRNVKDRVKEQSIKYGIGRQPMIACRVTQTYDAGACIYFYLAFIYSGLKNPLAVFDKLESAAREEILAGGGSLSHHHGVGKLRKRWVESALSPAGVGLLRAIKQKVDPDNIFGIQNLIPDVTLPDSKT